MNSRQQQMCSRTCAKPCEFLSSMCRPVIVVSSMLLCCHHKFWHYVVFAANWKHVGLSTTKYHPHTYVCMCKYQSLIQYTTQNCTFTDVVRSSRKTRRSGQTVAAGQISPGRRETHSDIPGLQSPPTHYFTAWSKWRKSILEKKSEILEEAQHFRQRQCHTLIKTVFIIIFNGSFVCVWQLDVAITIISSLGLRSEHYQWQMMAFHDKR